MLGLASALLAPLAGLLVLVWLTIWTRQFPCLGWLMISGSLIVAWEYPQLPRIVELGGLSVYPEDAALIALAGSAVPALRQVGAAFGGRIGAPSLLVLLLAASILRGVATHGVGTALNDARGMLLTLAATVWVLGQRENPGFARRFDRFVLWTGAALVVVALYHIGVRGIGEADGLIPTGEEGQYYTTRPLVASQSAFLALAGMYLLWRRRALWGWAFLALVVVAQARSVWVAGMGGMLILFSAAPPRVRNRILAGVAWATVALLLILATGVLPGVYDSLGQSFSSRQTLEDRTSGWAVLVERMHALGWDTRLIGQPMGTGYDRLNEHGAVIDYAPHNWYVTLYLRIGLLGVVALAATFASAAVQIWRDPRRPVLLAIFVTLVLFGIPYSITWQLAPFLAVALGRPPLLGDPAGVPGSGLLDIEGGRSTAVRAGEDRPHRSRQHSLGRAGT